MIQLLDRTIERVSVVDDDPQARSAYRLTVEDADLIPIDEPGPMRSVDESVNRFHSNAEAVLCDHNLRKRHYADFDGAALVSACNAQGFPAVLCTQYETPDLAHIRPFRQHIPVLLTSDDLEPDRLVQALEVCIDEIRRGPGQHRRLWRSQVRVVDEGEPGHQAFHVVIPAWASNDRVAVLRSAVPPEVASTVREGRRYHVGVNLGADSADELYFGSWEVD